MEEIECLGFATWCPQHLNCASICSFIHPSKNIFPECIAGTVFDNGSIATNQTGRMLALGSLHDQLEGQGNEQAERQII